MPAPWSFRGLNALMHMEGLLDTQAMPGERRSLFLLRHTIAPGDSEGSSPARPEPRRASS